MLLSTDDGSAGMKGFASQLLHRVLDEQGAAGMVVCVCGPTPMMKSTAEVAAKHGARCYLSLESSMACGFGVCVGCVVGVKHGSAGEITYKRTCIEGPVMESEGIVW